MKNNLIAFLASTLLCVTMGNSQEDFQVPEELQLTKKDSTIVNSWMVGLGFNAVDDAGSEFTNFFNVTDNWNILPYPSRVSLGKYFKSGFGIEVIGAMNRYQEGKTVDNIPVTEEIDYSSIDLRFSYDLNKILGDTGFFDPYIGLGIGYTDASNQGRGTYNTVLGFRTWLTDRWGLDFNSSGKWTMNNLNSTNHIQHAAGVVYRFGIKKDVNKKGEEKLQKDQRFQETFEKEQDSLAAVQKLKKKLRP